jgi:hypothetical protein
MIPVRGSVIVNTWQSITYWALIGATFGLGSVLVFSVGIPLMLLGLVLVIYAVNKQSRTGYAWVSLVTLGLAPAILLASQYLVPGPSEVLEPDSYVLLILLFVAIAIAGAGWGIWVRRRIHADHKGR